MSYNCKYIIYIILSTYFSVVICEALQLPENGDISYNESLVRNEGYTVDTLASFTCNSGYNLNGSDSSICRNSGNWNQETPTCDRGKISMLKLF